MSDKETLLSMGFFEAQVTKALAATKNAGLSQALDYIDEHANEPSAFWETPVEQAKSALVAAAGQHEEGDEEGAPGGAAEAKSLTCTDCGKRFRNHALASYHGEKSGHDNFEESTEEIAPLTEEERKAKLAELQERMLAKKKLQQAKDREEALKNDAIRRKAGKDQAQIKADMQLKAAQQEAAQRAKDKLEDAKARAAIKAQIEADKKARAEKAKKEKALRDGGVVDVGAEAAGGGTGSSSTGGAKTAAASAKTYDQTRLQIRVPSGAPLVHAVASTETLGQVVEWIREQTGLDEPSLSSAFPRKTYSPSEYGKTMTELGLAPSVSGP
ncbi:BQ2448_7097 [Microbotryum intermedium]|uniref:BQ2448_7097 protein n=1 Tax=Microbotryum intermedium TaxID=269621 RepID=A0A238FH84_9BASI|nr:BQ2448_7097 [Microbotryum intermedium]